MSKILVCIKRVGGSHFFAVRDLAGWIVVLYLPVAIVLVGSQWLLTVPVGPIFFLDPFLLAACLVGAVQVAVYRKWPHRETLLLVLLLLALPTWATVHLLRGDISLAALREYYPFLVLIWGAITLVLIPRQSEWIKRRGAGLLRFALGFHWITVSYRMISAQLGLELPTVGGTVLFRSGPHVDGLILGFFSGLLFWRTLNTKGQKSVGFALAVFVVQTQVVLLDNRATILASLLILFVVLATHSLRIGLRGRWNLWSRNFVILLSVLIGPFGVVGLLQPATINSISGAYSYVLDRFDSRVDSLGGQPSAQQAGDEVDSLGERPSTQRAEAGYSDSGTVRARLDAWQALAEWLVAEPSRIWAGVGFGSDYLWHSGATKNLLGEGATIDDGNKWAHNHALTIAATLGFPALIYFLGLCVFAFIRLTIAVKNNGEELALLAMVALVGVSVSSLFSVIFENPWGSVPLVWALAIGFSTTLQQERNNTSGLGEGALVSEK